MKEKILDGETKHFKMLKDHERRDLHYGAMIGLLIEAQIAEEKEKKRQLGAEWPVAELERGDLLFSNDHGSYLSYRTVYNFFKRRVNEIGRPEVRLHDLRHAYAMLALESGDSIKTVADHLGQSTPDFTLRVYNYVTQEAKIRSAENMSRIMADYIKVTRENQEIA